MDAIKLSPESLAEMIELIENGTISGKIGKQILPKLLQVLSHGQYTLPCSPELH